MTFAKSPPRQRKVREDTFADQDAMGRILIREGKRWLNFSPTDAAFGKNPGQLAPLEIQHPDKAPDFLAGVMQTIKDKLNAMSEEQIAAQVALSRWRDTVEEMKTADDFNRSLSDAKKQSKAAQALFAHAAKDKGLEFDKQKGEYVAVAVTP